jgi:hydrogenase maturation protease
MNKKDIRRTTNPQSAIRNPQSKNPQSVLVACIGNIFHGDDAFGVEVARRLAERKFPDGVRVVDFGIRGFDLAFAVMDGYDVTIFVDATPRGKEPGTLYVIEPDLSELEKQDTQSTMVDTHGMNPMRVLNMARSMGAQFKRLLVVGCEPETLGDEEEGLMGLSEPVQAAVERAIDLIESLISKEIDEHRFVGQSASLSTT